MYDLVKKILKETNGQICKHCLGRKLSHIVEGRDNINRGEKIFEDLEIPEPENCVVCGNIFDKINDDLFKKIYDKIDFLNVEFNPENGRSFLSAFLIVLLFHGAGALVVWPLFRSAGESRPVCQYAAMYGKWAIWVCRWQRRWRANSACSTARPRWRFSICLHSPTG